MTDQSKDAKMACIQVEAMLCFDLYSTHHAVGQVYKPLLQPLGITYPQYLVLTILWASDDLTIGAIGERLYLESSTLTPLIKRLEAQGLVKRKRDREDERKVRVTLTKSGDGMREDVGHIPNCVMQAFGLPLEDLIGVHEALGKIRAALLKQAQENAKAAKA